MPFRLAPRLRQLGLLFAAAIGICAAAIAADEQQTARAPALAAYRQECAACHIAYPPGMLPAASWNHVLSTLPHHYGTDASLDPATVKRLSAWLQANAATSKRGREAPPDDRITRSAWFVREHDEVAPATWKLAAVKNASNCAACHTRSDQGDFNERFIRIPR